MRISLRNLLLASCLFFTAVIPSLKAAPTVTATQDDAVLAATGVTLTDPIPTLGTYPNTSIPLSSDTTITPSATPANTTTINVSTSTNFNGNLTADPATGVVRVTNAHHANIPPGTYTVTIKAFGPGGSASTTFMLTVTNGTACGFVTGFILPAVPQVTVGTLPTSVAIGNFNNDGIQDFAVANRDNFNVSILLGNGAGGFTAAAAVGVGDRPFSVAIGDFNNDGKQDLAVVNGSSGNVSIRLGNGAGGFTSPAVPEITAGTSPFWVAVGDFNNDGKPDLAVTNTPNDRAGDVSIRLGDGAGGFTSPAVPEITVGLIPNSVAIGDFNNDGKQDFAAGNWNSGNVSIRLGDGAGGFTSPAPAQVTVGSKPQSVAIGDFNNDGKQDLAVANSLSNSVSILLGNGAGGFAAAAAVVVGTSPNSVAIGDFNNDGKQDFAVANFDSGSVSIRLGNGVGGFTAAAVPELTVGSRPFSVAIGDFNGDGIQDLAAANFSSNNVSIRLGGCSPATTTTITSDTPDPSVTGESITVNFTVAATPPGMGTPTGSVTVSDGVNSCSGPLSAGAGSCMLSLFTAGARTLTASYPGDANFNGSSGTDSHTVNKASVTAAIISDLPDPSVIGQSVTVNYTATVTSPGSGTPTGNVQVTDGVNSCIGTPAAGQCVIALFTPGMRTLTATFQGDANYNASPPSAGAGHQVNKADTTTTVTVDNPDPSVGGNVVVNFSVVAAPPGGGAPTGDVVVTVSGGAETCTGTVASGSCTLALTTLGNRTLMAAYAGDTSYNGSSGTAGPSPTLGTYPNASITLSSNTTIMPSATPSNTTGIHVSTSTNFNGELTADPATGVVRVTNARHANIEPGAYTVTVKALGQGVSTPTTFMLRVTNGTACGSVTGFTLPPVPEVTVGTLPTSVAIGDFNNDGKQDLAVANRDTSNVSIRLGDGAGGFTAAAAVVVGIRPFSVAIGDFNNDGKQDLAVANHDTSNVSIRLGDGAGGFTSPATPEIPVGLGPISVAIGDFNGDGRLDFATANDASNNVSIRLGNGAGGFTSPATPEIPVGLGPQSVAIGDFNNDGKQDFAAANWNSGNVSIRLGDGAGGFTSPAPAQVTVGSRPQSVAIGDFNNDGKQDLAVANSLSNSVSIRLGNGAGGFTSPATPEIPVGLSPYLVVIGDFNNDGKQDFAAANFDSGNVSIRLGDGAGGFTSPAVPEIPVGSRPISVAIGDFNGDGIQDFAAANFFSNNVSIRLGNCTSIVLTVNKTADTNDGVCDVADCSLREALAVAASDGLPDTIIFNIPANSAGCVGTDCTITLTSNLFPAADAGRLTTIKGYTGTNSITLSGNNAVRILTIDNGAKISIDGVNFTAGNFTTAAGIYVNSGMLTLTNCALFNNTNPNSPGGAISCAAGGVLNLTNVTISGNSSAGGGAGIINSGTVTATNCTIANNSAGFSVGGIANNGTFIIGNTIIAGNTAAIQNGVDASGTFTSQGHNLLGKSDGATGFTATGDQTGTVAAPLDPQLVALANNGGPTLTRALQMTSPAINAGDDLLAPPSDQRGFGRNGVSDIGAYEFNGTPPFSLTSAVSRKTHGGAGDFDIDLLNANFGPECRSSGGNHTLVFTFTNNVTSGSASVTSGTGSVSGSPSFSGNTMTVSLTGVTDVQKITVTLSNVTDSFAQVLPNTAVSMNMLIGDVNGNKTVNSTDVSQTKLQSGQAVTAANFREDVNINGQINGTDVSQVKLRVGSGVP